MAKKATRPSPTDLPGAKPKAKHRARLPVKMEAPTITPPPALPDAPEITMTPAVSMEPEEISVSVPFVEVPTGSYVRRRHDLLLTSAQAKRLKGIQLGLELEAEELENGKFVSTPTHAVMWLIENTE